MQKILYYTADSPIGKRFVRRGVPVAEDGKTLHGKIPEGAVEITEREYEAEMSRLRKEANAIVEDNS